MYAARTLFLVGTGVLILGTAWCALIWKLEFFLPDFWNQPVVALVVTAIGGGMSWFGKRMGGDVFGDTEAITEYGTGLQGIVDHAGDYMRALKRGGRKAAEPEPQEMRSLKMQAYSDMLQDAPGEAYQPAMPQMPEGGDRRGTDARSEPVKRKARGNPDVLIPQEQRAEVIAQLLAGGVKAAERFMEKGGAGTAAESAEAKEPKPAEERDFSAEDLQPVKPVEFHTGRQRLEIRFPQVPTDSWIGGGPSLPEGTDWPQIGGKPASFYAQIAVGDLPEDIWGGVGPRQGWLVIFGADDPASEVIVLHTVERGTERGLPEGADYYFAHASGEEALAELIGPEALMPPRWFLSVVSDDAEARPELGHSPMAALTEKPTMTDPGFLPFDWVTMVALLDAADDMLERMIQKMRRQAGAGDAASGTMAEGMGETLEKLRLLADKVEARAEVAPFSERDCAKVIGALAKLTNAGWQTQKAQAEGRKPLSLLQFPGFASYRKLYETQARRLYASDPAALPEATLKRLQPLWEACAAQEVLYVGNDEADKAEGRLPKDAPLLLLMPPSHLAGWQIGDLSRWAVQIAPRDLGMGRLDRAFSENSHGGMWDA